MNSIVKLGLLILAVGLSIPLLSGQGAAASLSNPGRSEETPNLSLASRAETASIAQRAVFYEEKSGSEAGAKFEGKVVWSVVNEPSLKKQPLETAIRGVVEVPDLKIRLTMTIRHNSDATLPGSHVAELFFEVPPASPEGGITVVKQIAFKPTEEATGTALIGISEKMPKGLFWVVLNNTPTAIDRNTALMREEKWIDIPIAFSSGRRALIAIEKGTLGDRTFNEVLSIWSRY